jgi:hypothetical protein
MYWHIGDEKEAPGRVGVGGSRSGVRTGHKPDILNRAAHTLLPPTSMRRRGIILRNGEFEAKKRKGT